MYAPSQLKLKEYLRYILFINSLDRKIGNCNLINTDLFVGECIKLCNQIAESGIVFANNKFNEYSQIVTSKKAKAKLYSRVPFLEELSFKNYRLVGGACTSAVRESIVGNVPDDVDFFPLVERVGNESEAVREARVQQIYESFLREIEEIYKKNYSAKYKFFIYRNEDCTTILINNSVRINAIDKHPILKMKIQFVHRVFETEAQMLLSSDLTASQILFNGQDFLCTTAGFLTLVTGIIPIDFSTASTSMGYRLFKYARHKNFLLAFCGFDAAEIKKIFASKKKLVDYLDEKKRKYTAFRRSVMTSEERKQFWLSRIILVNNGLYIEKSHSPQIYHVDVDFNFTFDDNGISKAIGSADYSGYDSMKIEEGGDLAQNNLTAFFAGRPLFVYSRTVDGLLENACVTDISDAFRQMANIDFELKRDQITSFFGEHAEHALLAHFHRDEDEYSTIVENRIDELNTQMKPLFAKLRRVKWRMSDPGAQCIGSMKPIKISAREGYGEYYSPFLITYAWELKREIVHAFRRRGTKREERGCFFTILSKDLIKHIFFQLDKIYALEQFKVYSESLFRVDKVAEGPVKTVPENFHNEPVYEIPLDDGMQGWEVDHVEEERWDGYSSEEPYYDSDD